MLLCLIAHVNLHYYYRIWLKVQGPRSTIQFPLMPGNGKRSGSSLEQSLAKRFCLPKLQPKPNPVGRKRVASGHTSASVQGKRQKQSDDRIGVGDPQDAQLEDSDVGMAEETDEQHLARHKGARGHCARCKFLCLSL